METIIVGQTIKTSTISTRFRQVALKLGYVKPGSKKQHGFRPKRFRHLFITLCENSMVSNRAIKQMVGHAEDMTDTYKELSSEDLLREYKKVEPFVDIFKSPSVIEHDKDLKMLKQENVDLQFDLTKLKKQNESIEERFEDLKKGSAKLYSKINLSRIEAIDRIEAIEKQHGEMSGYILYLEDEIDKLQLIIDPIESQERRRKEKAKEGGEIIRSS